jgi:hypothetical protein
MRRKRPLGNSQHGAVIACPMGDRGLPLLLSQELSCLRAGKLSTPGRIWAIRTRNSFGTQVSASTIFGRWRTLPSSFTWAYPILTHVRFKRPQLRLQLTANAGYASTFSSGSLICALLAHLGGVGNQQVFEQLGNDERVSMPVHKATIAEIARDVLAHGRQERKSGYGEFVDVDVALTLAERRVGEAIDFLS